MFGLYECAIVIEKMNVIGGSACLLRGQNLPAQTSCEHTVQRLCLSTRTLLRADTDAETKAISQYCTNTRAALEQNIISAVKVQVYGKNLFIANWWTMGDVGQLCTVSSIMLQNNNSTHFCSLWCEMILYSYGCNVKMLSFIACFWDQQ